jgi:hypothetical protein
VTVTAGIFDLGKYEDYTQRDIVYYIKNLLEHRESTTTIIQTCHNFKKVCDDYLVPKKSEPSTFDETQEKSEPCVYSNSAYDEVQQEPKICTYLNNTSEQIQEEICTYLNNTSEQIQEEICTYLNNTFEMIQEEICVYPNDTYDEIQRASEIDKIKKQLDELERSKNRIFTGYYYYSAYQTVSTWAHENRNEVRRSQIIILNDDSDEVQELETV